MRNGITKVCTIILIYGFISFVAGVIFTALEAVEVAGYIAGGATALCVIGWFFAMYNLRLSDEGDYSSEAPRPSPAHKVPVGTAVTDEMVDNIVAMSEMAAEAGSPQGKTREQIPEDIPESEWL